MSRTKFSYNKQSSFIAPLRYLSLVCPTQKSSEHKTFHRWCIGVVDIGQGLDSKPALHRERSRSIGKASRSFNIPCPAVLRRTSDPKLVAFLMTWELGMSYHLVYYARALCLSGNWTMCGLAKNAAVFTPQRAIFDHCQVLAIAAKAELRKQGDTTRTKSCYAATESGVC